MKEYMLIFRNEKSAQEPSAAQMEEAMKHWQQWISGIAKKGNFVRTNRLLSEGKTIRANKTITDGPYVESKEMIGGYLIVKTNSLADAMELAKDCPQFMYGGNVEVRAVMNIDNDTKSATFLEEVAYA